MYAIGILFLVAGLLISVGIHELGHLIPAKRYGVKVSQYFIGFGPTLWSKKVRGTEYGIKLLPLGGFVRIAGMLPPGKPGRKTVNRRGKLTLAEEVRRDSLAEIGPGEDSLAFWQLSARKKFVVMFGGPLTNLVLAALCLTVVLCGIGVPRATSQVGTVIECVDESSQCAEKSPAAAAGLRQGDVITAWGGESVEDWEDLVGAIGEGGTGDVSVTVLRDGQEKQLTVRPVEVERTVEASDGTSRVERRPYVGIRPERVRERQSPVAVADFLGQLTHRTADALVRLPVGLWETARSLVTHEDRSNTGVVGIVGVADMAGEITSSEAESYDWLSRLTNLLLLIGSLNMTLFLFNLIPLLPLDGGHLAGATFEGVRRWYARLRGRPDPGPADMARLMPLSYAVAVGLVFMVIILVAADVINPVGFIVG
ncbi:MAG: M50 family metallopeptidase [Actinomycetaceae bacterium]|nr:M50 family metallopeptidase [Actinomycetaceae bacterium]